MLISRTEEKMVSSYCDKSFNHVISPLIEKAIEILAKT